MGSCSSRLNASVVLAVVLAAVGCSNSKPKHGLVVSVTSDMQVPKDLDRVTVQLVRNGSAEPPRDFDLSEKKNALPLLVEVPSNKPQPDQILVRVSGWQNNRLRLVREASTQVPKDRRGWLSMTLQWLCDGQVDADASPNAPADVASSCGDGLTCVLGECRSIAVAPDGLPDWDPKKVYGGGEARGEGMCLDMGGCFDPHDTIKPDDTECTIERVESDIGLNVALALPPGRDGFCSDERCLIPLDGFSPLGGWIEEEDRILLPPAACERVADGRLLGVVVSGDCRTKTISVPICAWERPNPPGSGGAGGTGGNGGAGGMAGTGGGGGSSEPDAGVTMPEKDASLPPDAEPFSCSKVSECRHGDTCCPAGCNGNNDRDCAATCGNGVIEADEVCDGDCPTSCPQQGCTLRRLADPGTCKARCVDAEGAPSCGAADQCCPMACNNERDSDCACVPKTETCNNKDDDCDGQVDEGVKATFYRDQDGDGFGNPGLSVQGCAAPAGYVSANNDCDDGQMSVRPNASEACDGRDNDCDGSTDEGVKSTFYRDADGDGFGNASSSVQACAAPAGYVSSKTDCNDGQAAARPGGSEVCDGLDNDCDGSTDEGVKSTFYQDADGDGYGSGVQTSACTAPAGYVAQNGDCNDNRRVVNPAATEACDLVDNNCADGVDEGCAASAIYDFSDNLATLTAYHPQCTPSYAPSDACNAAIHRYCKETGSFTASGFGPLVQGGAGGYRIACVNRNIARSFGRTFAELSQHHGGCDGDLAAFSPACGAAVNRWCSSAGYVSGFGATEHADGGAQFTCVSRGMVYEVALGTLNAYSSGCDSYPAAMSQACFSAYHRYCVAAGWKTGFGPNELSAGGIMFTCIPEY